MVERLVGSRCGAHCRFASTLESPQLNLGVRSLHTSSRMARTPRVLATALLIVSTEACDRPREIAATAELGPARPAVFAVVPPLPDPGPVRELCLILVPSDSIPWQAVDPNDIYQISTAAGHSVRLTATIVRTGGHRQVVPANGVSLSSSRSQLCFREDSAPAGAVTSVELHADGPVVVGRVTWYSGDRSASLSL